MTFRCSLLLAALSLTGCDRPEVQPPDPDPILPPTPGCFQVPPEWTRSGWMTGTALGDEWMDVAVDARGTLHLAGYEQGLLGETNVEPAGDARGVLLRVEASAGPFATRATRTVIDLPGTAETLEALALHPISGEPYFVGRTTGAFAGYTNRGEQDVFVGGPGASSPHEVLYQGGTRRPQHPNRLAFDHQGQLLVSGFDDLYSPGGAVEAWEDPFVFKLRRTAEKGALEEVWWRQSNTSYPDVLTGLAVDTRGEAAIYVTGANSGGAARGSYVRRLDPTTGDTVWTRQQVTGGQEMMQAAHVLPEGDVLIAGTTFARLGDQSYGEQDGVVRRLDASGQVRWTRQFGSKASDYITDMAVDAAGNIYVVGETLGALDEATGYQGNYDVFLVKLDPQGTPLLMRHWGSAEDDHASAVAVDACGEAFIVGYTTGALLGSDFPPAGSKDAFLLTTAKPGTP